MKVTVGIVPALQIHSLCPLKKDTHTVLATLLLWQVPLTVPTQEAHQYSCCTTNHAIITPHSRGKLTLLLRPLRPSQLLSLCRPKRHTEPCRGTPPSPPTQEATSVGCVEALSLILFQWSLLLVQAISPLELILIATV